MSREAQMSATSQAASRLPHQQQQQQQQQRRRQPPQQQWDRSLDLLPNGPPPFRPSSIVLGLSSAGLLDKLKQTKLFKRMYKSKVYYLFLDALQQLAGLVDKIGRKKIDLAEAEAATIQAVVGKLTHQGGQRLKLKWPLVMLNPHFLKELLANPTFLVMLFHAIEVAYTSMPLTFWLKPLVKLVKQPSPEQEEKVWWRRKRIYDALNGHGSSELQPNLKAAHFGRPGAPAPFAAPNLVNLVRQAFGRPQPVTSYYKYPTVASGLSMHASTHGIATGQQLVGQQHHVADANNNYNQQQFAANYGEPINIPTNIFDDIDYSHHFISAHPASVINEIDAEDASGHEQGWRNNDDDGTKGGQVMTAAQADAFLANQAPALRPKLHLATARAPGQQKHDHRAERTKGWLPIGAPPLDPIDQDHRDHQRDQDQRRRPPATNDQEWALDSRVHPQRQPPAAVQFQANGTSQLVAREQHQQQWFAADKGPDVALDQQHRPGRVPSREQLMSQAEFDSLEAHERDLVLREAKRTVEESRLTNDLIRQQDEFVESLLRPRNGEAPSVDQARRRQARFA